MESCARLITALDGFLPQNCGGFPTFSNPPQVPNVPNLPHKSEPNLGQAILTARRKTPWGPIAIRGHALTGAAKGRLSATSAHNPARRGVRTQPRP